jgi:hypothetical protein
VTHRLAKTAAGTLGAKRPAARLVLAALLCASVATAQETAQPGGQQSTNATPATPAAPGDDRWLAWTALGVGGGLLAASAWQWVVFANENAEAGDLCRARSAGLARCADAEARARYVSARDDAKNARVLAAVLSGLGAASLVTGILLFPDSDAGSAQTRVALSVDPVAGDARASLWWTW